MGLEQFAGKHFSGQQFDSGQFDGGGDSEGGVTCVGTYYANKIDIEYIFGRSNTRKWADIENTDSDDEINIRICWALKQSHNVINNRLTGGPYSIPFAAPYPAQITDMCARLAGVMLYESRGVTDMTESEKPRNQLSYHREMVMKSMNKILSGRIRFFGLSYTGSYPEPVIEIVNQ